MKCVVVVFVLLVIVVGLVWWVIVSYNVVVQCVYQVEIIVVNLCKQFDNVKVVIVIVMQYVDCECVICFKGDIIIKEVFCYVFV